MFANKFAVYVNLCGSVHAFEFKIRRAALGNFGLAKLFYISTCASVIIVSAVLSVVAVPCVRQVDVVFAAVFGIYEFPAGVDVLYRFQNKFPRVLRLISSVKKPAHYMIL